MIVEDEKPAAAVLEKCLSRYGEENSIQFSVSVCYNPIEFLENYQPLYDIIYMDISMPEMTGMEAAKRLRKIDTNVMLIFVTSLAQYALEGYTVGAFDYILKPVRYYDFALKLRWAVEHLPEKKDHTLLLVSDGVKTCLHLSQLMYAETDGHYIVYHTKGGELRQYGSLTNLEGDLADDSFVRCNSCYLVNMAHISSISGLSLKLDDGTVLKISQPKRKQVIQLYNDYAARLGSR